MRARRRMTTKEEATCCQRRQLVVVHCCSLMAILVVLLSPPSYHYYYCHAFSTTTMLLLPTIIMPYSSSGRRRTSSTHSSSSSSTRLGSSASNNDDAAATATTTTANSKVNDPFGSTTRNVATQVLQGAGPASIDLNQYNLLTLPEYAGNFEKVVSEWTANLVQKVDEKEIRTRLGAKNDRDVYVDTITVQFPRVPDNQGMGINLVELAGGREDGLGITVVESLVGGGLAAAAATASNNNANNNADNRILPGDSISSVSIVRTTTTTRGGGGGKEEQRIEEFDVQTECLSYDSTVDAILSLPTAPPPQSSNDDDNIIVEEYYSLKIKRLRRKPKVTIKLQYPPSQNEPETTIELFAGENLRYGMFLRDIKLNDPLAKRFDTKSGGNCGAGGLCRTCAVSVIKGNELLNPQRPAEKQMLADSPRWRLACKAIVGFGMKEGEMTVRVNPRQW